MSFYPSGKKYYEIYSIKSYRWWYIPMMNTREIDRILFLKGIKLLPYMHTIIPEDVYNLLYPYALKD